MFRPDGPILERLEWLTNVIEHFDGSEQRIRLRGTPRRIFEFAVTVSGRDRRIAENLLDAGGAQPYIIPVWTDSQQLTNDLGSGATSITVDTSGRDFRDGGLMCLATGPRVYEIVEIDAVAADTITLASPTGKAWPAGALVIPLRSAFLPDRVALARFTGGDAYGRLRWQCVDANDYTAATGETEYRSVPVLLQRPNWTEDVRQEWQRKLDMLDFRTGGLYVDDEAEGPLLLQSHRWLLDGRAEIHAFRQWLYARCGRWRAFWMPTWAQDFRVVASIGSSATTIDVEHSGYTDQIDEDIGRRDIRIELANGTVYYRRITQCVEVDGDTERLTINTALGVNISAADVALVSFMHLVRLNADSVEINWWARDTCEVALTVRSTRDDV